MNKKFLSAILFGALMVTSTGTFVSCKDYDDDIENLQGQIDKNSSAIAELQKLVGSGNWVTSISPVAGGFTVTMSNGQSQTITGINGADGKDGQDGKNGTEWTIGEDGYWYMDGEKTENLAVGENGENGATAPSPSISENGNWVLYTWDAEKGEFVAEETTIPAQGTAAYVVLKNGAYILHIADENGEYQEVALPATAESFTISAITNKDVLVDFTFGEWKAPTAKVQKEQLAKLVAEFPALEEYEDGEFVAQNNKLPFMVSPANVQLTKDHSFALVSMKGKDSGVTLSNPTMGMPEDVDFVGDCTERQSRVAEGTAVWSLDFEPALNEKGKYEFQKDQPYSLVVSGSKGIIAATPYVYEFHVHKATKELSTEWTDLSAKKVYNEDGMDIFVSLDPKTENALILPPTALNGMFILKAKDAAAAEEYGVEIEGSVVKVNNMPKGKDLKDLKLVLTTVSVNGTVAEKEITLDVVNEIAATGSLANQNITLKATFKTNGAWESNKQDVLWNIEDLGLSALELRNFVDASTKKFTITNDDEDAKFTTQNVNVVFLNEKKSVMTGTIDYTKVAYMKYVLDASVYVPGDYTVTLQAAKTDGTVIYKAEADMVVANPEESLLTLNEAFVDADGVFNAVGTVSNKKVSYDWKNFFKLVNGYNNYNVESLVDLDYEYDKEIGAWLTKDASTGEIKLNAADIMTWSTTDNAFVGDINQTRNFKIEYYLFNNKNNKAEFEFQVKLISSIYAADPTSVITITAATAKFDDNTTTTTVDESKVDLSKLFSAIYAAGSKKGTAYNLFFADGGKETTTIPAVYDYSDPKLAGDYVTKGGNLVSFTVAEYLTLYNDKTPAELAADATLLYITNTKWTAIWGVASNYYDKNGNALYKKIGDEVVKDADGNPIWAHTDTKDIADTDVNAVTIFTTYLSKIDFEVVTPAGSSSSDKADTPRAGELDKVEFKFVNEADKNYFTSSTLTATDTSTSLVLDAAPSKSIDITTLVEGQKVIPMQMVVTDVWGKIMTYEFNVTLSL